MDSEDSIVIPILRIIIGVIIVVFSLLSLIGRIHEAFFSDKASSNLPAIPPAPASDKLLAEARPITYEDIARQPEQLKNTYITFSGEVIFLGEEKNLIHLRVAVENDINKSIYVIFKPDIISFRILEDDKVQIWGLYEGLQGYETVTGSINTSPLCIAYSIKLVNEENKDNAATSTTTSALPDLFHPTSSSSVAFEAR